MAEPSSPRTTVRRLAERGAYDRETVRAILDAAFVCHVGFVDEGHPFVIPTLYARDGERLLLHGSPGSRMLRVLRAGAEVCLTVTILDGLVLARSAFHHSVNYRSVVVLGRALPVTERNEKLTALERLVEHIQPGRAADARPPNEAELRQTEVLALPLDEASAKIRVGPPKDEPDDYALPVWAGVVPLSLVRGEPVDDRRLIDGVALPDYLRRR